MPLETSRELKRADWRVRIATQAQSGLAMTEFCRRERLCSKTFYRCKARLASAVMAAPNLKLATFLKLRRRRRHRHRLCYRSAGTAHALRFLMSQRSRHCLQACADAGGWACGAGVFKSG